MSMLPASESDLTSLSNLWLPISQSIDIAAEQALLNPDETATEAPPISEAT